MLNHFIMDQQEKIVPFSIYSQEEIPFGYPNPGLYRQLVLPTREAACPHCISLSKTIHEYTIKKVISGTYNGTPVYDYFTHRRFECDHCHKTFMERLPWLRPYQRLTEGGRNAMLYAAADGTFKSVGEDFGRSGQNVKVHVRRACSALKDGYLASRTTPVFIGIDEISLAKGKGSYRLVIYDLTVPWHPELLLIHETRKKEDVILLLRKFSHPERIIAVAIDMWEPYKLAIEAALPHVYVVIDAFHVIQASTKALEEVRKQVQATLSKELSLVLKNDKELFAKPIEDLTEEEHQRLKVWEKLAPDLAQAVSLHQKLRALYRSCQDFEEALVLLCEWEKAVLATSLEPFRKLTKTIWNWLPEILNRFIRKISNAKTEGKNNQLRAMNKQGFGYSTISLQARMEMKEQQTALNNWRNYQDRRQRKLAS